MFTLILISHVNDAACFPPAAEAEPLRRSSVISYRRRTTQGRTDTQGGFHQNPFNREIRSTPGDSGGKIGGCGAKQDQNTRNS